MLPIFLRDVALFFPHKICFEHVSTVLAPGSRVGITGPNGSGKSTLLYMLRGAVPCSEGHIDVPHSVRGGNGSGKTTLLRGILGDPALVRGGFWGTLAPKHMGYLDQHYVVLGDPRRTVMDVMRETMPGEDSVTLRRWLNDFLFRKNEEVCCPVGALSGGERARLCLTVLAARSPRLLLLDEVTNNLDSHARQHVIDVLRASHCAMLLVSHDTTFLEAVGVTDELDFS